MKTLGAVLAGGQSRRFGSDKAAALYRGEPLLAHALAALRVHSAAQVIVGRLTALAPCAPDWPEPGLGPLGGLAGALRHARAHGFDEVLSLPVDCVLLPENLLACLAPAPAYLGDQPVIGLWPVTALPVIEAILEGGGSRAMRAFADAVAARRVTDIGPVCNINRPADLAALERAPPLWQSAPK